MIPRIWETVLSYDSVVALNFGPGSSPPPVSTWHSFIMNREYCLTPWFQNWPCDFLRKGTEGTVFQFCVLKKPPSLSWPKFHSSFSFNSLWKNPKKLFGQTNIFAIVVIIVFPGWPASPKRKQRDVWRITTQATAVWSWAFSATSHLWTRSQFLLLCVTEILKLLWSIIMGIPNSFSLHGRNVWHVVDLINTDWMILLLRIVSLYLFHMAHKGQSKMSSGLQILSIQNAVARDS